MNIALSLAPKCPCNKVLAWQVIVDVEGASQMHRMRNALVTSRFVSGDLVSLVCTLQLNETK